MINSHRIFNQEVYNQTDTRAKQVIINYFNGKGFKFKEGTKYGIDLLGININKAIEVEHRKIFTDTFPYSTVSFLARKRHLFTSPATDHQPLFAVVNATFNKFLVIPSNKLTPHLKNGNERVIRARGILDTVYYIPVQDFTLFQLN